jgi:hypothetical protein
VDAAESLEVGDDGVRVARIPGVDVVVQEPVAGMAAGHGTLWSTGVDDTALAPRRKPATRRRIDGIPVVVFDE